MVWEAKGYTSRAWKAPILLLRMTPEKMLLGRLCMKTLT